MKNTLIGLHEPGLEQLLIGVSGFILYLTNFHAGQAPLHLDTNNKNIVRLTYGYGNAGEIPEREKWDSYIHNIKTFISSSQNIQYVQIANEINLFWSWPNGKKIEFDEYIEFYKKAYNAIKDINATIQIAPQPPGPWNNSLAYPGNERGDWVKLLTDQLTALDGMVDWISIHTYSHGYNKNLIWDESKMGAPFEDRHYNFKAYLDFIGGIPENMKKLPIIITETNGDGPWPKDVTSTEWVETAFGEIDYFNNLDRPEKIHGMVLYRVPEFDQYSFVNNTFVHAGIKSALAMEYNANFSIEEHPEERKYFAITTARLNLRDDHDVHADVLTTIPQGEIVFVTEVYIPQNYYYKWRKVEYQDYKGYASGMYLVEQKDLAPTLDDVSEIRNIEAGFDFARVSNQRGVILLEEPDATSKHLGRLSYNQKVLAHIENGWALILTDQVSGYIQEADLAKLAVSIKVPTLFAPTEIFYITQFFGERPEVYSRYGLDGHEGIDFRAPLNTEIYAAAPGIVSVVKKTNEAYGNYVKIKHVFGETLYAHLAESIPVKVGQLVRSGSTIGFSGDTGNSTGPHLHFGFRPIDPDYSNGYNGFEDPYKFFRKEIPSYKD